MIGPPDFSGKLAAGIPPGWLHPGILAIFADSDGTTRIAFDPIERHGIFRRVGK